MHAFGEHRFSSSFIGFLVGLYITIHPYFFYIFIQSHTFVAENCAIGNIVKKMGNTVQNECNNVGFAHLKEK